MNEEKDIFINFLKRKNLKLTNQREKILETFLRTESHISVEDLYNIVKKKYQGIGQATVFRTLKLLCEADLSREVNFGDKTVRYEHKYGHEHHDHIVCLRCGNFIEAVDSKIEQLQDELCRKFGFLSRWHRLEIFGICKRCRSRENKNR